VIIGYLKSLRKIVNNSNQPTDPSNSEQSFGEKEDSLKITCAIGSIDPTSIYLTDSETLYHHSASIGSPSVTGLEINTVMIRDDESISRCEEADDILPTTLAEKRRLALLKKRRKPRKSRLGIVPEALRFINEAILTKCMESLTITVRHEQQPCDPSSKDALKKMSIFEILEKAYGHDLLPTYLRKCTSAISGGIGTQPRSVIRF